jgi:hypothetical protein
LVFGMEAVAQLDTHVVAWLYAGETSDKLMRKHYAAAVWGRGKR